MSMEINHIDAFESDIEEFIETGTYVFDAIMNGNVIKSDNRIIGFTGRNYNIIEIEDRVK